MIQVLSGLDQPSQAATIVDVATPLEYQSFCPAGAALNVVGERWALLIVRDLLLGPRRYSELLAGLGGIGTDILAARLRTLQEHGVVRQVGTGRARRYELTASGQALRPVLVELSRWGAERLRLPADPSQIPIRVPLTALLVGATTLPRQANGAYELQVDDEAVRIAVDDGQVRAAPKSEPATTIELSRAGLAALIVGVRASQLERDRDLCVRGDRQRAHALLNALARPPLLRGLRRQLAALRG